MIIYVDIDNTICSHQNDYSLAKPWHDKIEKINNLYRQGNTIIYWSARGATTNIDWKEFTRNQLNEWGCLYHELRVGNKPYYDILIDDKAFNTIEDYINHENSN